MKIILASNSPRRKELLLQAGFEIEVVVSEFDEKTCQVEPDRVAKEFALGKAINVFNRLNSKECLVIGADTVVFHDGKILGKAKNREDAKEMLANLSGKVHKVVTGYALLYKDKQEIGCATTYVEFNKLSEEIIESYLNSGLYIGKAGSYGIQDNYPLVKRYSGSLTNVIGLPIHDITKKILALIT